MGEGSKELRLKVPWTLYNLQLASYGLKKF
jgi:hypothetical protein